MLSPKILKLDNNLTVISDYTPHLESATVGIWSNIGSRVENLDNNGICHFLEHMVFKGTKTRSSFEISDHIESKGGYINAWTSKEKTTWYAKVLKEDVVLALEVLLDILRNSTFGEQELEKEKGVIIEEIKMYQDDPMDIAYNLYDKLCYGSHPLGNPIIGNEDNIRRFTSKDFFNHLQNFYYPSKMVIVISGNFAEEEFLTAVHRLTDNWKNKDFEINDGKPAFGANKEIIVKKEIEQTNLIYGLKATSYLDEDYYKMSIASTIFGGGMSSRLFTEIREKRGLAYSISSFISSYRDCGSFAVSAGCSHDNVNLVISLIQEELQKVTHNIEEKELQRAKNLLKSSLVMSLESSYSRANRFASNILDFKEIRDINKIITKINNTTKEEITEIYNQLLNSQETIAIVSNDDIKGF